MVDNWRLSNLGELMYKNYRIKFSDLLHSSTGEIRRVTGASVPLVVNLANNALNVGGTPANQMVNIDNISVLLPVTESPVVVMPSNVGENNICNITISNFDPTAIYNILADKGTVGNINSSGVFSYTAPDITNGLDTSVTFTIYSSTVGKVKSPMISATLPILYLPVISDAALVNVDFRTNGVLNDGYKY